MAEQTRKKKASKLRTEADRSSARGEKLRFDKAEQPAKELTGRNGRKKQATAKAAIANHAAHDQLSRANEDENVGGQAADFGMETAEDAARVVDRGVYSTKLKVHRREDSGAESLGVSVREGSAAGEGSNSASRWKQKADIKKEYAAAKRGKDTAGTAAGTAERSAKKAKDAAKEGSNLLDKLTKFVQEHSRILLMIVILGLLFVLISSAVSSCSAFVQSSTNVVIATSYTAQDADIIGANDDYKALEAELQRKVDTIERTHPGYDEYNYFLDEIGHDPYQLASYLTVMYEDYTRSEVQSMLQSLFDRQYELKLEEVVEIRYRTETRTGTSTSTDPDTGETTTEEYEYEVEVPYEYYILNVTLANKNLGHVITESGGMDEDQQERYAILLQTKGNKAELFEGEAFIASDEYLEYDIPGEALTDERFRNMINEAEKYLGYPYVWGGSIPSTSFDCSGFVSYVINHCGNGWNVGRLTANGLKNTCAIIPRSEAKPGDLVFFQGTYNTSGASHVGIYVGNGMMIHCGNPISYASIDTSYWQSHFYCFGRLP